MDQHAAVHVQRDAGAVGGEVAGEIHAGARNVAGAAQAAETIPLARLGRASDVAGACVYLASDLAAYCTGITLDVNGGMLIH